MQRAERIRQTLIQHFSPRMIELVDDSHKHRGHQGWREGEETHFTLQIQADSLTALSRVAAQQAIYRVLGNEFQNGLHALAIKVVR